MSHSNCVTRQAVISGKQWQSTLCDVTRPRYVNTFTGRRTEGRQPGTQRCVIRLVVC
jgi:hypothetical protein